MITFSQKTEDYISARYSISIGLGFIQNALEHLDGKFDECFRLQNVISELDILHSKVQNLVDKLVNEEMRCE